MEQIIYAVRGLPKFEKAKTVSTKTCYKMQLLGFDVDHYFIRRVENGERFVTDK